MPALVPSDSSEESDLEAEQTELLQKPEESRRGTLTHMSPLDVRFSQKKMRHMFWNGNLLADVVPLVHVVKCTTEEKNKFGAGWKLQPPFPEIEVMRWRCKLRDEKTGRPKTDPQTGRILYDQEEHLFTLDNRRLYCLQVAAVTVWPEHCVVEVSELPAGRPEFMHEMKKFKTMDSGRSILIGSRQDKVPFFRWLWEEKAAAAEASTPANTLGKSSEKAAKGKSARSKPKAKSGRKSDREAMPLSADTNANGNQTDGGGALLLRMLKDGERSQLVSDEQMDGAAKGAHLLELLKGPSSQPSDTWPQSSRDTNWWGSNEWWQTDCVEDTDKGWQRSGYGRCGRGRH